MYAEVLRPVSVFRFLGNLDIRVSEEQEFKYTIHYGIILKIILIQTQLTHKQFKRLYEV